MRELLSVQELCQLLNTDNLKWSLLSFPFHLIVWGKKDWSKETNECLVCISQCIMLNFVEPLSIANSNYHLLYDVLQFEITLV